MKGSTHAVAGMAVAVGGAWAATRLWGEVGAGWFGLARHAPDPNADLLQQLGGALPPIPALVALLMVGWVGGQFPDLDLEHTTISHSGRYAGRMATGLLGRRGAGGVVRLLLLPFFWLLDQVTQVTSHVCGALLGGHRGGFHSVLAGLVCGAGASGISFLLGHSWAWGVVFGLAFLSHLILDSLNPTGIMWGWPLNQRYLHLLGKGVRIMSDDTGVNVVLQVGLLACIAGALWQLVA